MVHKNKLIEFDLELVRGEEMHLEKHTSMCMYVCVCVPVCADKETKSYVICSLVAVKTSKSSLRSFF